MNITNYFSEAEREKINQAVTEAEKKTSAEIVPVLTDASGSYDRAEDTFGVLAAVLAVIGLWALFQGIDTEVWATADKPGLVYNLLYVVLTIIVAFIVGAAIASKIWSIRHLFTPRSQMRACLERGAQLAFHMHNLSRTEGATGVLIYMSLFERMVYVLGDTTISEKLSDADLGGVKDSVTNGFRRGEGVEGLCEGIRLLGERLAEHFPIQEGDSNELSNELVLFEQNL